MSNRGANHYARPKRDENRPIGHVTATGYGSGKAGRNAMDLLATESPLMIVVANGEVFALDAAGLRAEAVTAQHPEWIVGTYTHRCGMGTIACDLVEHCRLARMVA